MLGKLYFPLKISAEKLGSILLDRLDGT